MTPVVPLLFTALAGLIATAAPAFHVDDGLSAMQMAARVNKSTPERLHEVTPQHESGFACPLHKVIYQYNVSFDYTIVRAGWIDIHYTLTPLHPQDNWEGLKLISYQFRDCKCAEPDAFTNLMMYERDGDGANLHGIGFKSKCSGLRKLTFDQIDGDKSGDTYIVGFTLMDSNYGIGKLPMTIVAGTHEATAKICGPICDPAGTTTPETTTPEPTTTTDAAAVTTTKAAATTTDGAATTTDGAATTTQAGATTTDAAPTTTAGAPATTTGAARTTTSGVSQPSSSASTSTIVPPSTSTEASQTTAGVPQTTTRPAAGAAAASPVQQGPKFAPTIHNAQQGAAYTVAPSTTLQSGAPESAPQFVPQAAEQSAAPAATAVSPAQNADSATMFGDPHVGNLHGEKFDILNPDSYTFLVVPRGTEAQDALFHVLGRVEALGPLCSGVQLITGLVFSGQWVGEVGRVQFSTTVDADIDAQKAVKIKVGTNHEDLSLPEFQAAVPASLAEVMEFQPGKPSSLNEHATTLLVKLRFGPCTSKVRMVYQKEKDGFSNSLWLTTTGLGRVTDEIGGILGYDDHELAASIPNECKDEARGNLMRPNSVYSRMHAVAMLGDQ